MTLGELSKVFHVSQVISIKQLGVKNETYELVIFRVIAGCMLQMDNDIKNLYNKEIDRISDDSNNFITIWLKK